MAGSPGWRYRVPLALLSPLILGYTLWRAGKDGGKRYLLERLGFYEPLPVQEAACGGHLIWVHAASVGEVLTVLPLLQSMSTPLLVTTMSPTGARVLEQQAMAHVQHRYLPVDFPGACRRFFNKMRIAEGWIVETEIWPWLYATAKAQGTPLAIINARLSDKTRSQANGWLSGIYRQALNDVTVLARSEYDAQGFVALGASPTACITVGNLKYASSDAGKPVQMPRLIRQPYVLAASTHADEEILLAQAWSELLSFATAEVRLVIVPRHPERGGSIRKQLTAAGIASNLRSSAAPDEIEQAVLIADTLGELQAWYSFAIACFVGGSLIERGGHNVLEAARAGCPASVGPHTFNFEDIVSSMRDAQALHVATDASEVIRFFQQVIEAPDEFEGMRGRALGEATRQSNIVDDYRQWLLQPHDTDN